MGKDVPSGISIIEEKRPELVFLDVEMPFGNAFDLLEQLLSSTASKSLPNFEEVEIFKSSLKYHPKARSLFSVLTELKEENSNMQHLYQLRHSRR